MLKIESGIFETRTQLLPNTIFNKILKYNILYPNLSDLVEDKEADPLRSKQHHA